MFKYYINSLMIRLLPLQGRSHQNSNERADFFSLSSQPATKVKELEESPVFFAEDQYSVLGSMLDLGYRNNSYDLPTKSEFDYEQ